jgi:solute carrier family 25 S-adenosylmethionine transporter 26
MLAASGGEVTACIVRVPTEVVKQRLQTGLYGASLAKALSSIWQTEGLLGFYRGYGMTLFREACVSHKFNAAS